MQLIYLDHIRFLGRPKEPQPSFVLAGVLFGPPASKSLERLIRSLGESTELRNSVARSLARSFVRSFVRSFFARSVGRLVRMKGFLQNQPVILLMYPIS